MGISIKQIHPHKEHKSIILLIELKDKLLIQLISIPIPYNHLNIHTNNKNHYQSNKVKPMLNN
jgi:hypothetical protein